MKTVIYVLEDNEDVAKYMAKALESESYVVKTFHCRSSFLQSYNQQTPDLCLIDLGLPDGDGLSIIADTLKEKNTPSIVVTGKQALTDKVIGLEVGADDYVIKPFEPRELLARVRAVLRRVGQSSQNIEKSSATFDGWSIDFDGCVIRSPDGIEDSISAAEARLLTVLLKSAGKTLSRAQLIDYCNNVNEDPLDRSIDARISRVRKKLGDCAKSPSIIRTVYGVGYVFTANVEWTE